MMDRVLGSGVCGVAAAAAGLGLLLRDTRRVYLHPLQGEYFSWVFRPGGYSWGLTSTVLFPLHLHLGLMVVV